MISSSLVPLSVGGGEPLTAEHTKAGGALSGRVQKPPGGERRRTTIRNPQRAVGYCSNNMLRKNGAGIISESSTRTATSIDWSVFKQYRERKGFLVYLLFHIGRLVLELPRGVTVAARAAAPHCPKAGKLGQWDGGSENAGGGEKYGFTVVHRCL